MNAKSYRSDEMMTQDMTTVQAVAHWYRWAKAGGLADHTANQYRSMVLDFFATSGIEFYEVNSEHLVDWAERLNARGSTVSSCGHKALQNFWRFLIHNGLDDRAIAELMPYTQPRVKIPAAFTPGELSQLWAVLADYSPGRWGHAALPLFKFLYFTGARRAEALNVSLEDLTTSGVTLRTTKRSSAGGGSERFIPFGPAAGAELTELVQTVKRRGSSLAFPFGRATVVGWCRDVEVETGLHVHPHKFRATFATTLLTRGVDIRTVQELLGHADIKSTMKYLAVTDERKASAVSVL